MLRVTYTGGDAPQHWTFDPDAVPVDEAERIEAAMGSGRTYGEFTRDLISGTARSRRVLLWHLMQRDHPGARIMFSDVPVFTMGELVVELGTAELQQLIQQVEDNDRVTPERKDRVLASLQEELASAAMTEAEGDVFAETEGDGSGPKDEPPTTSDQGALADPVMPGDSTTPVSRSRKSGSRSSMSSQASAPRRPRKSA